jgi:hypothetical protein
MKSRYHESSKAQATSELYEVSVSRHQHGSCVSSGQRDQHVILQPGKPYSLVMFEELGEQSSSL